jgi:ATP-dependent Clp protease protease subunit
MSQASYIPIVVEQTSNGERSFDIFSRLLKDRIVMVNGGIDMGMSSPIIAQLLHLQTESPDTPIVMHINSPGGSVHAGLAIIDTMNYISCPVYTIGMGICASMGAAILSAGEKGHRYSLPRTTVMIHSVSSGTQGTVHDMAISHKHSERLHNIMIQSLADQCGKTFDEVYADTARDYYLIGQEAADYGLVDQVIHNAKDINK